MSMLARNYTIQRKGMRVPACEAIRMARVDADRARLSWVWTGKRALGHGDVIRYRDVLGDKQTAVIAIVPDDDATPPWERSEGHGPVSEWTSRDKAPGERVLAQDRNSKRYYDAQAAQALAIADWGLGPDDLEALTQHLGRVPTRREIAARAVDMDYERLRTWCNDQWQYVGVVLFELPRDQEMDARRVADDLPFRYLKNVSVWGIEDDSEAYIEEMARELVGEFN